MKVSLSILFAAALAAPAGAEVVSAGPPGFVSENRVTVAAAPAAAYAALTRIGSWWDPAHTYSGDAANLSLDARAGGCFCEATPADGGGVAHMRVVQARPGALLRMEGGLGPLQGEAVSGILSWTLRAAPGGGTEIVQTYKVSGAESWAAPVDAVLNQQLTRLAALLAQ
ncbi:MAG: ATPase [Allosphingosinicella sp.]|uniref:ATPase n=1 Tax=Allosphingosinicella sp. TaxID=2823234 RepID=UPI0039420EE2